MRYFGLHGSPNELWMHANFRWTITFSFPGKSSDSELFGFLAGDGDAFFDLVPTGGGSDGSPGWLSTTWDKAEVVISPP